MATRYLSKTIPIFKSGPFWIERNKLKHVGATLFGLSLFTRKIHDAPDTSGGSLSLENEEEMFNKLSLPEAFMAEPITDRKILDQERHLMRRRMEVFILSVQKAVFSNLVQIERNELNRSSETNVSNDTSSHQVVANSIEEMISIDRWTRSEGGGGITCIIKDGRVFEKAGVNISVVYGQLPPAAVQQMKSRGKQFVDTSAPIPFFAAGVSSVIHPCNPNVPTIHFNYRYFEVDESQSTKGATKSMWWFGGGTDLTPYLLDEADCRLFHGQLKQACEKHNSGYYERFKKWCDDYFFIKHRKESRGVGGIFFDDLDTPSQDEAFGFVRSCAHHIMPSYLPIVHKNMHKSFTAQDRDWQLVRRGRYAEFNLVYDRGTKFGLMTPGARYESILMSLPPLAKWVYCHEPAPGSPYEHLLDILKQPREWV